MSEETVKAYRELAELEEQIGQEKLIQEEAFSAYKESFTTLKGLSARKRELLKVVKVVRTRKKPEPKKVGRPKGSKNKGKTTTPASQDGASGADSKGEPATIAPEFFEPEV